MRGHDAILNLRRNRMKPAYVWLQDTGLAPTDLAITLSPQDIPEALDLRILVGVTVLVEATNRQRLGRILKACMDSKPKRVIGSLIDMTSGYPEIIETTDTEGVLTWTRD